MASVGEILRNSRLSKEWTPEAASRATKIRVPQLLALERNDFSKFAAPAYARGFVRIYARCLGLDEKAILSQLDGTYEGDDDDMFVHAPAVDYVPERIRMPLGTPSNDIGWKIIVGGFLVFLLILGICIGIWLPIFSGSSAAKRIPGTTAPSGTGTTRPAGNTSSAAPPAAAPSTGAPRSAGRPNISTEPDVPTAQPAGGGTVSVDTASPPATAVPSVDTSSVPTAVPAAPVAPGEIPTAQPVTDTESPAAAVPQEPYTLRLTAHANGVRIKVTSTTKQGNVTETYTLNSGQFHEFHGSSFDFDTSAPNATSYRWNGVDSGIIDSSATRPGRFNLP